MLSFGIPAGKDGEDGKTGPQGPAGPPGPPGKSPDLKPLLEEVRKLQEHVEAYKQDAEATKTKLSVSEDLLLYYTSNSCTKCANLDKMIDDLKAKGWPVVVTRLAPRDAGVVGVPKIYMPFKDYMVEGISNCENFVSSLVR